MAFERLYEIIVSDPKYSRTNFLVGRFITDTGVTIDNPLIVGIDANTEPASAKVFTPPLQMEFSCVYSTDGGGSNSAEATLRLYNLSDQARRYFNSSPTYVAIKAGFRDSTLLIIYAGQVLTSTTQRSGSDIITTIVLKDSYEAIQRTRIARKWPANTPYKNILKDLAGMFSATGITTGYIEEPTRKLRAGSNEGVVNDTQTPSSYIVEGYLSDALDEICYALGMTWYVVHNKVYVVNGIRGSEGTYSKAYGVIIKPENIIGLMAPINDTSASASDNTPTGGVKFSTFLNGNLSTEKYIDVKVKDFEGIYKVTGIKHTLDYRGGDWITEVEATIIG